MRGDKSKEKYCDYNNFKRVHFFHGMLLTEKDFKDEQKYHMKKRKLINRMLHGWGVVCGLKITPENVESSKIIIQPGLALDCAGNEILVCEPYELDVVKIIGSCFTSKQEQADQKINQFEGEIPYKKNKWYVVIRYKEIPTDRAHVYFPGGGCEEKVCEHSRMREGYCIDLVEDVSCPEPLNKKDGPCEKQKNRKDIREFLCEELIMPCETCCCDNPEVVLGSITFNGNIYSDTKINTDMINNWDCRRYVITFGLLQHWMRCFAPEKIPFEYIVDYTRLGEECEDQLSTVKFFENIFGRDEEKGKKAPEPLKKGKTARKEREKKPSPRKK